MTAFSGTGLADFAQVARNQVLCSHTLYLSLTQAEHSSDAIEQTAGTENRGDVGVKVVEIATGTKKLAAGFIKRSA